MRYLVLFFILILGLSSCTPYNYNLQTINQYKTVKKFNRGKIRKHRVPFSHRTEMSHPTVKKETKRIKRYRRFH